MNSYGAYPSGKDKFINNQSNKSDIASRAITEFLHEATVVSSIGLWTILKSFFTRYCPFTLLITAFVLWIGHYCANNNILIKVIHNIDPMVFTADRLTWVYKLNKVFVWGLISSLIAFPFVLAIGIYARGLRTKYKALFYKIGLTNGSKDTPKLIKKVRLDKYRSKFIFDSNGVGLTDFESKKERLEAVFAENIDSLVSGKNKSRIEITFNKKDFPKKLTYLDLTKDHELSPHSFFIGHSTDGILTQDISELPHMLIAGATNSGKSVFFKQALMGLLESTPHIQMYLIDLKGGLEMIDFVKAPNVRVIKTVDDSLKVFRKIEREMKNRFDFLEKKGLKSIKPTRDKKDRIIVAVDEASVLYANRGAHDPDRESALEARALADSISKLSRAAGIHLLLATQKVENSVIPTSVTENISGRMVFRANSFQGSNQVLGSKDAMTLPEIPGRGIWKFGTKKLMVQGERSINRF